MTVAPSVDTNRSVRRVAARRGRYALQRTVWAETKIKRLALCGRVQAAHADGIGVKVSGAVGSPEARAGFSGLQSCGSVWSCPVCAEKINAERQADLEAGITRWLEAGHSVLFGTLTLRHNRGHRLKDLLDAISPAWNRTTSGAGVQWNGGNVRRDGTRIVGDRERFGIAGFARVVETKHGRNGWHPHVHFLLFLERELKPAQVRDLERRMFGRWEAALADRGLSVVQSVGIDLRPVSDSSATGLSSYFTKNTPGAAAYEVTGSQSKQLGGTGSRTPFQILEDLTADGLEDDLKLWHEWEAASKGRRQLTWSRGMRDLLALEDERDDQEIVEDDQGGELLLVFTRDEWRAWRNRRLDLLEAAERGTLLELVPDAVPWDRARRRSRL